MIAKGEKQFLFEGHFDTEKFLFNVLSANRKFKFRPPKIHRIQCSIFYRINTFKQEFIGATVRKTEHGISKQMNEGKDYGMGESEVLSAA